MLIFVSRKLIHKKRNIKVFILQNIYFTQTRLTTFVFIGRGECWSSIVIGLGGTTIVIGQKEAAISILIGRSRQLCFDWSLRSLAGCATAGCFQSQHNKSPGNKWELKLHLKIFLCSKKSVMRNHLTPSDHKGEVSCFTL